MHLFDQLMFTKTIFTSVSVSDILEGCWGWCVFDGSGGCSGGRHGGPGGNSWGQGMLAHVFLEWAVIPEGIVALGGQVVVCAVEAQC